LTTGDGRLRFAVHRFESVDSTSDECKRMADSGAPEGTVAVARIQTAGRGRLGRRWISSPGDGLYMSIILRPPLPLDRLWQIGFALSLATADAVTKIAGTPAALKWPNDVLLNKKKISGILVEAGKWGDGSESPDRASTVVVGIGINVNTPDFPSDLVQQATSVFIETGRRTDLRDVEDALLAAISDRYRLCLNDGFDRILQSWKSIDVTPGRKLTVRLPNESVEGTAIAIDGDGNLILRREDGITSCISTGEIILHNPN
jgi:BirA family biotin operon repressor/biotin-[acetyl-CoA-carboxylase] ligase